MPWWHLQVNVLDEQYNPGLRDAIKKYSEWPTIPQVILLYYSFLPGRMNNSWAAGCKRWCVLSAAVHQRGVCGRRRHFGGDAWQGGAAGPPASVICS